MLPIIAGSVALVLTAAAITQASTPESEAGAASAHSEGSATSACVDPPSGLVTWWPGDGSAEDVQGGHDGTLTNGATFAPGMVGDAFSLDGVDDFVSVPDSPDWNFGSRAFSIDLWLEFNQLVGRGEVFVSHDESPSGGPRKWVFWYDTLGHRDPHGPALRFHISRASLGPRDPVVALWTPVTGQWYHVAITRSGSTYALYIDGVQVITETDANAVPDAVNVICGGGDVDLLRGGAGDDRLLGGGGNDLLIGGDGNDELQGGSGTNRVSYAQSPAAVAVNLTLGTASGEGSDAVSQIQNVTGSPLADTIVGSAAPNSLAGLDGDDVLSGTAGNDVISGGTGNDVILGGLGDDTGQGDAGIDGLVLGAGNDTYQGGLGINRAVFSVSPAAVTADLLTGSASGEGTDQLLDIQNLIGSPFADSLAGDDSRNVILGGAGDDHLVGFDGNDNLQGQDGNDDIDGGAGTDACQQGPGTGTITNCP